MSDRLDAEKYAIDRCTEVLEELVKKLNRTVSLQIALTILGLLYIIEPGEQIGAAIGYVRVFSGNAFVYIVCFFLVKLFLDWGYSSYRYLIVRETLERQLETFFRPHNRSQGLFNRNHLDVIFIPTSIFSSFYNTQDHRQIAGRSKESRALQFFFAALLIGSLCISNLVALFLASNYFSGVVYLNIWAPIGICIGICAGLYHYYDTLKKESARTHYMNAVLAIAIAQCVVLIGGFPVLSELKSLQ